jgi:hypothetical protein
MYNPVLTAAGPIVSSYPYMYGGGLFNRWGRYGYGPNYGLGYSGMYNPYSYMSGTFW